MSGIGERQGIRTKKLTRFVEWIAAPGRVDEETRKLVYEKIGEAPPELENPCPELLPENVRAWEFYREQSLFNRIEHDSVQGTGKVLIDFNALKFLLDIYCSDETEKREIYRKVMLIHTTAYKAGKS